MINIDSKVFLAGHNGMLGSSIFRILKKKGTKKIITIDKKKLDLRNQIAVKKFIKKNKPDAVIIAAAKVGGIKANIKYPADFISDNLQIQTNLILSSRLNNVKKLIFVRFQLYLSQTFEKTNQRKSNIDRTFRGNK